MITQYSQLQYRNESQTSWGRFGSSKQTDRYPTDVSDSPLLTATCVQNTHDLKLHELSVWSSWVFNRSADYNGFAAVTHVNYIFCSFFKFIVLVHRYMIFDERDYRFIVKLTVLFQLDVWLVMVCLKVSIYFADSKNSSLELYALISETSYWHLVNFLSLEILYVVRMLVLRMISTWEKGWKTYLPACHVQW